jgi:hypothetical protein
MVLMSFKALAAGTAITVAISLGAVSPASAEVRVAIANGRATVVAKDATLRQILAEWARVGQVKIVNLDRVPGGPITLELPNMPEAQALDVLLRSISGYIAAPREVAVANASQFDRIVVLPTPAMPRAPATAVAQQPAFAQPMPIAGPPPDDDVDDERPAPPVGGPMAVPPRGPVFNPFPQPQVTNPQQPNGYPQMQMPPQQQTPQQMPATSPQAPPGGGVAVPGMIVAPPPQPGQVVPPATKRPGGPGGL